MINQFEYILLTSLRTV